ncbi:hypothetical protein AX15_004012 [Amanita polypyramis BW_CC]|nr:hypothetical protein AX15_004012 [Amanita polypyramis BW_CC]
MSHSPLQSYSDFDFTFDPSLSNIFPNPPPLSSSADLFSAAETTDLLGFLDAFGDFNWDLQTPKEHPLYNDYPHAQSNGPAPYSNPHLKSSPDSSTSCADRRNSTFTHERQRSASLARSIASDTSSPVVSPSFPTPFETPVLHSSSSSSPSSAQQAHLSGRAKPLLSIPQKRLNHIMSEQKRRNAIRDGYAQLITLLSPAGSAPTISMPTRGRPKGSSSRGKGQSKGKSGVLFRAVEYCRWLEEGRDALRNEVLRAESAAGIRHY